MQGVHNKKQKHWRLYKTTYNKTTTKNKKKTTLLLYATSQIAF